MTSFLRWLQDLASWWRSAPVAPHYWYSIIMVAAVTVTAGMFGWSEKAFRLLGMILQVFGALTAVWGILKTRAEFGHQTLRSQLQQWFINFPSFHPRTNKASMDLVSPAAVCEMHGYSVHGPSTDQTAEGRLTHLEKIVNELEIAQRKTHIAVFQAEKKAQQALDDYSLQFTSAITDVSKKIELTATGGIHVSAMGVILLIVGTIFGTAASELSYLLTSYLSR